MVVVLYAESHGDIRIVIDGFEYFPPAGSWSSFIDFASIYGILDEALIIRVVSGLR